MPQPGRRVKALPDVLLAPVVVSFRSAWKSFDTAG
jgi:hypothetical protein